MHVGRVVTCIAAYKRIFSRIGQNLEFVGEGTPHCPCVCLHRTKPQATAGKDPLVRLEHVVVFAMTVLHVRVEAIGVLHNKLPSSQKAKAWTHLIAELGLDLV